MQLPSHFFMLHEEWKGCVVSNTSASVRAKFNVRLIPLKMQVCALTGVVTINLCLLLVLHGTLHAHTQFTEIL